MKKKLLSMLLALTMVTSLFSGMTVTAGAEGEEPAPESSKIQLDSYSMEIDLSKLISPGDCTAENFMQPADAFSTDPAGIINLASGDTMRVWIHNYQGECIVGQCDGHTASDEEPIFLFVITTLHEDYELTDDCQVTLTGKAGEVCSIFVSNYNKNNNQVTLAVKFGENSTKGEIAELLREPSTPESGNKVVTLKDCVSKNGNNITITLPEGNFKWDCVPFTNKTQAEIDAELDIYNQGIDKKIVNLTGMPSNEAMEYLDQGLVTIGSTPDNAEDRPLTATMTSDYLVWLIEFDPNNKCTIELLGSEREVCAITGAYAVFYKYEEPSTPSTVPVTGVTLDKESLALTVGGETGQLNANVAPDNATNKAVTWSSNNSAVATVADGVVTAVGAGTAEITVTTTDGNFTDTCLVTVTATQSGSAGHTHCVCGDVNCLKHGGEVEWIGVGDGVDDEEGVVTLSGMQAGKHYYLTENVDNDTNLGSYGWEPPAGTVLCLNGHVVNNKGACAINVVSGDFTLADCQTTEYTFSVSTNEEDTDGLWVPDANGDKKVTGGVITGGKCGVFVAGSGNFTMYGGNIVGSGGIYEEYMTSIPADVGGIWVRGATTTIFGGTICGNRGSSGGGIYGERSATINVYGGEITENVSPWAGGGCGGIGISGATLNVQGAPVIKDNKLKVSNSSDPELSAVSESAPAFVESNVLIFTGGGSSEMQLDPSKINITGPLHRNAEIGVTVGNNSLFTNGWSANMVNKDPGEYFFADEANGFEDLIPFEGSTDPDNLFAPVELRFIKLNDNEIINVEAPNYGGDVNYVSISLDKTKTFGKLKNSESLPALEGTPVPEEGFEEEIPNGFKMGLVSGSAQTSGVNALDSENASIVSEWVYAETDDFVGIVNGQNLFQTMEDDHVVDKTNNVYFIKMTIIAPVTFTANTIAGQNGQFPVGIADTDPDTVDSMAFIPVRFEAKDNRITVFFMDATTIPGGGGEPPVNPEPETPSNPPASTPTVQPPVSNDKNSVNVQGTVYDNEVTINPLTDKQLDKILSDENASGDVVIDLTGLKKTINGAGIPKKTMEAIVDAAEKAGNDTEHLVIKLTTAELTLDDTAMRAIVDQAKGHMIRIHFDDVGTSRLNAAQKENIKDMDIRKGFEAYISVDGKRVSDFKGGEVEIVVPYAVPAGEDVAGFSVWYIDENGNPEKQKSTYDGKNKWFVVTHFSDYVIAYNEEDVQTDDYSNCPKDETCPIHPFTDTNKQAWYHDGVHYCIDNGYMIGVGNNQFAPSGITTRAQIVTILWRMEGSPLVAAAEDFDDVYETDWYNNAIRWASANGVVEGYGNGAFGPNDTITREQVATILWRYCKYKGIDVSVGEETNILSYEDAFDVSSWAMEAMQWACGSGMIQGIDKNNSRYLDPQGNADRSQSATMIFRFCTEIQK